jgi:ABC-type sugar transport system ATPase subunit
MDELPRIVDAFRATTILVTHSRDEALRLASDLVVLVEGKVLAVGETHRVAGNPRITAVAQVLGYTVLTTLTRRIAVPPAGLRLGGGQLEFPMTVVRVVDLIDGIEIVGRIGDTVVRLRDAGTDFRPEQGDRLTVHATRFSELD